MRMIILHRLRRLVWANLSRQFTWWHIIVFILLAWVLKYGLVMVYCFMIHQILFQWTSCPTEQLWPKNFSNMPARTIDYALEPQPCSNEQNDQNVINIVIFIPVHVSRIDRRQTIRETWIKPFLDAEIVSGKRLETKFIFVVGSLPSNSMVLSQDARLESQHREIIEKRLRQESASNGDILQPANVVDDYYNITLKIRGVLQWTLKHCSSASYVIRADSDIVLDYRNLLRFLFWLKETKHGPLVAGYCRPYDCITRWGFSKTCLPRTVYQNLKYSTHFDSYFLPRYCFGFSYILSNDFVRGALRIWNDGHEKIPMDTRRVLNSYWPLDDAYLTGYLAEMMDIHIDRLNHPNAFNYRIKFDAFPCENGVVASGAYDDDELMKSKWMRRLHLCHRLWENFQF